MQIDLFSYSPLPSNNKTKTKTKGNKIFWISSYSARLSKQLNGAQTYSKLLLQKTIQQMGRAMQQQKIAIIVSSSKFLTIVLFYKYFLRKYCKQCINRIIWWFSLMSLTKINFWGTRKFCILKLYRGNSIFSTINTFFRRAEIVKFYKIWSIHLIFFFLRANSHFKPHPFGNLGSNPLLLSEKYLFFSFSGSFFTIIQIWNIFIIKNKSFLFFQKIIQDY